MVNLKFIFNDSEIKKAGSSLRGMIRFTYFEDYKMPEYGWEIDNDTLIKDYHTKIYGLLKEGKTIKDILKK